MGVSQNGCFFWGKSIYKWIINGVPPISGNPHRVNISLIILASGNLTVCEVMNWKITILIR